VLSTVAFWTSVVQDGCDYARLEGEESIEKVASSDVFPFVEAGISQYRVPIFYPSENEWKMAFTEQCQDYSAGTLDTWWEVAKYSALLSDILGGSLCFFLWFATCMSFSIRTWRLCAVNALLAAFFRLGSFLFFFNSTCSAEGNTCSFAFGSQADIFGTFLLVLTASSIFFHYPDPKLIRLKDEEIMQFFSDIDNLEPKQLVIPSHDQEEGSSQEEELNQNSMQSDLKLV